MTIHKIFLYTSALAMISATTALANPMQDGANIKALPNQGTVRLTGTVASIEDKDSFTLRDVDGNTIDVHTSAPLAALSNGDRVRVSGEMRDEVAGFGEEIGIASVEVLNNNASTQAAARDMAKLAPAAGGAEAASVIDGLPQEGTVSLSGTVDKINNDTKFTLRDAAGEKIDINTSAKVAVNEGDSVNVDGRIQPEAAGMGREIIATDVTKLSH